MRNAYIAAIQKLAIENPNVLALVADNGAIVYDEFRRECPKQFINFGIAEANMITMAAGMASCGKIPFAYTIANFITMRGYEQIRNDVCLQKQNVKLVGVGAGVSYSTLGPTHHSLEDIAILRVLPNMTIIAPATPKEAYAATVAAAEMEGPVYIRLETTKEPEIYGDVYELQIGKGVTLTEGKDLTIIATGGVVYDSLQAVQELHKQGISIKLINMHTVKPIDQEIIRKALEETGGILTVEEHSTIGGLGSAVEEVVLKGLNKAIKFDKMGFDDCFAKGYCSHQALKDAYGLSARGIMAKAKELIYR